MTARSIRLLSAAALLCAMFACVSVARAGTWMQVSCVNPDGSAAPSEGWTSGSAGGPGYGSSVSVRCGPGAPMYAILSSAVPDPVGATEYVEYQPPSGSTLVGGTVDVNLYGDGGGTNASGDALLYTPAQVYPDDVFFQCAWGLAPCGPSGPEYEGPLTLPSNAGGGFIAAASCGGNGGESCNAHSSHDAWALAQVVWGHFLLSNSAVPVATGFSGTALERSVRGTGHLLFTATDAGGPGIYSATVTIDGNAVWSGTPNTNGGACVPVGTDAASGALMFDHQQPCPATEAVSIPVPTSGVADGSHEMAVSLTDAAGNTSPVLDQTITTSNPQTTPAPSGRRALHARFVISWRWAGTTTLLRSIRVTHLPRNARVAIHCAGTHCPRLRATARGSRKVARMLRKLGGRRLSAGQSLLITVTAGRHRAERIAVKIRNGLKPSARLLR
jgi:hypothetical protein